MNNDLAGLLFNTTKRPNRNTDVNSIATFQDGFDPNRDRYFDRAGMDRSWTAAVRQRSFAGRNRARIQEYGGRRQPLQRDASR